ncbi:hypothetical protein LJ739_06805 [Aestuariibacter halophilus]|uniref:Lipoprotein n=1 Tax=Fluctibacter halophilus TaxID=226011 RepID=A0ABS8G9Q1_9ALTE|nr:hypothetical protein [Aestuariibacter halophilus]MCC2615946.1 hypothetical protein [Aestuariibacter halophilus]
MKSNKQKLTIAGSSIGAIVVLIFTVCAQLGGCGVTEQVRAVKDMAVNEYCATNDELTRQAIRDNLNAFVLSGSQHKVEVKITCAGDVIPD